LGFEIVGVEGHVVFVKPKGSSSLMHLCERCDDWRADRPGARTGVWLRCGEIILRSDKTGRVIPSSMPENVVETYDELKRNGVEFSQEITTTAWGKMAVFKDPDGNEFEIS